jgi:hypothetical protein
VSWVLGEIQKVIWAISCWTSIVGKTKSDVCLFVALLPGLQVALADGHSWRWQR